MKKMIGIVLTEVIWIFLFVIFVNNGSAEEINKEYVKIGAIFDSEAGSAQELAFNIAVDFVNSAEGNFLGRTLVARTEKVSQQDSFGVSKAICKMIKDGVVGIFDPTLGHASRHVQSICAFKGIPYIKTRVDHYRDKTSNLIDVYPNPAILSKVYADLAETMKWKHFTIVYENTKSLTTLSGLFKHSFDDKRKITFKQFDDGTGNYRAVLQNLKASGETNFVLDCSSTEKLYDVLLQAQQIGLLIEKYSFIITSPDLHTMELDAFMHGGANITGIRLTDPENQALVATVKFWNSSNRTSESDHLDAETISTDVAMIMDAVFIFASGLRDINTEGRKSIDCEGEGVFEQGSEITDKIKNNPILGLTDISRFDESGFRTDFGVNIIEFSISGFQKVGSWASVSQTLNSTRSFVAPTHMKGTIEQNKFTVLIHLNAPYGMLKESSMELHGNDRYEGFGVDMIEKISQMLDFEYELTLQKDGVYGHINTETNEWNGMIGSIINWEADLAVADLTITPQRAAAVDFTMPFMNLGISILYQKPQLMEPNLFFFLEPFSCEVWLYIAASFLGVSLLLYVMARISPKEWKNPDPTSEKSDQLENQFGLLNSMWFTGASAVQQRSGYSPVAISTRMVACLWWFFTLIIACFYIANLVSIYLNIETYSSAINSVEDLVNNRNGITYGGLRSGSTVQYFKNSDNPTYMKMSEYMTSHPESLSSTTSEGVERVKTENYAFLMESTTIEYITQRECNLAQIGGLLNSKGLGIAMRKNSPYRDALSNAILKMQEDGTLASLKKKWWNEKRGGDNCVVSDDYGQNMRSVELGRMKGLFLVLLMGCIAAVVVACFEMICGVVKNSHKHKVPFRQQLGEEWRTVACGKNTKLSTHTKNFKSELPKESDDLKKDALLKESESLA